MASIVVNGDTSGSVTLSAPAVAGSTVLTLPSTSGTVLTTASGQWITSGSDIYYNTGNVGIGTTSPTYKLHVASTATSGNTGALITSPSTDGTQIRLNNTGTNGHSYTFYSTGSGNGPGAGCLGIYDETAGAYRTVIDSSGNLLLGQTSQNSTEKLGLTVSGSNSFAYFRSTATSGNPVMVRLTTGNLSGGIGTGSFVYCDDGGSAKFFVAGSGVVNSTSTSITAISDSRLKENVRDLETGLNTVLALKPRRFDWKQGEGTDQKDVAGFIAQEVETVLPELVGEWKHDPDSETIYKSLAMGNMIPTMVKAIQELKAELDTVKAELAALKG